MRFICSLFEQWNCHSSLQLLTVSSATDHSKKIPRYSAELARKMADRFIALYDFHSVFVHGVVKLSFSNKFFSDRGYPHTADAKEVSMLFTHNDLLRDSAQASSNVFSANQKIVHSWATYWCCCKHATLDFVKFIVRAVFKWLSKVITWLRFNQWDAKPKLWNQIALVLVFLTFFWKPL